MSRKSGKRLALVLVAIAAAVGGIIGLQHSRWEPSSRSRSPARAHCVCTGVAAQARVDAFALVAKRIYANEHAGVVGRVAVRRFSKDSVLLRALRTGDLATARKEARRPMVFHEVRIRIARGSHVLVDVGLPFVVQGARGELRGANGVDLGRLEVSIQDVIGFVKLVHRETGAEVVVRSQRGNVKSSLGPASHVRPPVSGKVNVGGRTYLTRSFAETGFNGERLTVWILERV